MKTVTIYETKDGRRFDDLQEAQEWDTKLYEACGALIRAYKWLKNDPRLNDNPKTMGGNLTTIEDIVCELVRPDGIICLRRK